MDAHPVRLAVSDDLRRSRATVAVRLLLALPLLVWLYLWSIGVSLLVVVAWVVALVRGRVPDGLHEFLAMYVRYATQLGAYLALAADPYPGFLGRRGYPVDVELPAPRRQARWSVALRLPLAVPALVVGGELGRAAVVCAILGWFAVLALGRMPLGLRDLSAFGLGYGAQATAYLLLVTDRYPHAGPSELGPAWSLPEHEVRLVLDDDGRRSRVTVAFRLLLALPHLLWLAAWTAAAAAAAAANALVVLARGRSGEPLHRFLAAYVRYGAHVTAFVCLIGNPFPGFTGTLRYPVDVAIAAPGLHGRWSTLLRTLLVVPALVVSAALASVLAAIAILGWFAALVSGRMPRGLRDLGAICVRYLAQTAAYWLVVADRYPFAGPALAAPAEVEG